MKHMMSDMESRLASTEQYQDKKDEMETAYKGIIRALENETTPEQIAHLKGIEPSAYCSTLMKFLHYGQLV